MYVLQYKPSRPDFIDTMTEKEMVLLEEHFEYLTQLRDAGQLKLAGRRMDGEFGIVLLEGITPEGANEILAGDPIIKSGVFHGTVGEFKLALEAPRVIQG